MHKNQIGIGSLAHSRAVCVPIFPMNTKNCTCANAPTNNQPTTEHNIYV